MNKKNKHIKQFYVEKRSVIKEGKTAYDSLRKSFYGRFFCFPYSSDLHGFTVYSKNKYVYKVKGGRHKEIRRGEAFYTTPLIYPRGEKARPNYNFGREGGTIGGTPRWGEGRKKVLFLLCIEKHFYKKHNKFFALIKFLLRVHKEKLKKIIKKSGKTPVAVLITKLNREIRNWLYLISSTLFLSFNTFFLHTCAGAPPGPCTSSRKGSMEPAGSYARSARTGPCTSSSFLVPLGKENQLKGSMHKQSLYFAQSARTGFTKGDGLYTHFTEYKQSLCFPLVCFSPFFSAFFSPLKGRKTNKGRKRRRAKRGFTFHEKGEVGIEDGYIPFYYYIHHPNNYLGGVGNKSALISPRGMFSSYGGNTPLFVLSSSFLCLCVPHYKLEKASFPQRGKKHKERGENKLKGRLLSLFFSLLGRKITVSTNNPKQIIIWGERMRILFPPLFFFSSVLPSPAPPFLEGGVITGGQYKEKQRQGNGDGVPTYIGGNFFLARKKTCHIEVLSKMNLFIYKLLWLWARKRHNKRSNRWIFEKYWKFIDNKPSFYTVDALFTYYVMKYSFK